MENKTTMELLEILRKKGNGAGDDYDEKVYEAAFAELCKRSPFWELLDPDWEEGVPALWLLVKEMQADIKALKRHKHDVNRRGRKKNAQSSIKK